MTMQADGAHLERARRTIADRDVRFISMQFSDIVGHVKSVTIPVSRPWSTIGRRRTSGFETLGIPT